MKISLIVAISANNVIGADGGLPWKLSDDLKRFKAVTMGKPILMGRTTFESIGKALPGRRNIVMTRQKNFIAKDCELVSSAETAIEIAADAEELMVIGGASIYALFLPRVNRIYRTRVHADIEGDTFFPPLAVSAWHVVDSDEFPKNERNEYAFTIETLERRGQSPALTPSKLVLVTHLTSMG